MLDYILIRHLLATMNPRQRLFKLVKAEMQRRGHWKVKPRGKPMAKGYDARREGQKLKGGDNVQ